MPGFILLLRERGDDDPAVRLGLTVSRKVGGAVVRNRMKRRFRALARECLPESGVDGADLVLIGRPGGIERDYGLLRDELRKALRKVTANAFRAEPVEIVPSTSPQPEEEERNGLRQAQAERSGAKERQR
jgi:ribonuclease P protein component